MQHYSACMLAKLAGMVLTGAGRTIVVKLFYQLGYDDPLFMVVLYLFANACALPIHFFEEWVEKRWPTPEEPADVSEMMRGGASDQGSDVEQGGTGMKSALKKGKKGDDDDDSVSIASVPSYKPEIRGGAAQWDADDNSTQYSEKPPAAVTAAKAKAPEAARNAPGAAAAASAAALPARPGLDTSNYKASSMSMRFKAEVAALRQEAAATMEDVSMTFNPQRKSLGESLSNMYPGMDFSQQQQQKQQVQPMDKVSEHRISGTGSVGTSVGGDTDYNSMDFSGQMTVDTDYSPVPFQGKPGARPPVSSALSVDSEVPFQGKPTTKSASRPPPPASVSVKSRTRAAAPEPPPSPTPPPEPTQNPDPYSSFQPALKKPTPASDNNQNQRTSVTSEAVKNHRIRRPTTLPEGDSEEEEEKDEPIPQPPPGGPRRSSFRSRERSPEPVDRSLPPPLSKFPGDMHGSLLITDLMNTNTPPNSSPKSNNRPIRTNTGSTCATRKISNSGTRRQSSKSNLLSIQSSIQTSDDDEDSEIERQVKEVKVEMEMVKMKPVVEDYNTVETFHNEEHEEEDEHEEDENVVEEEEEDESSSREIFQDEEEDEYSASAEESSSSESSSEEEESDTSSYEQQSYSTTSSEASMERNTNRSTRFVSPDYWEDDYSSGQSMELAIRNDPTPQIDTTALLTSFAANLVTAPINALFSYLPTVANTDLESELLIRTIQQRTAAQNQIQAQQAKVRRQQYRGMDPPEESDTVTSKSRGGRRRPPTPTPRGRGQMDPPTRTAPPAPTTSVAKPPKRHHHKKTTKTTKNKKSHRHHHHSKKPKSKTKIKSTKISSSSAKKIKGSKKTKSSKSETKVKRGAAGKKPLKRVVSENKKNKTTGSETPYPKKNKNQMGGAASNQQQQSSSKSSSKPPTALISFDMNATPETEDTTWSDFEGGNGGENAAEAAKKAKLASLGLGGLMGQNRRIGGTTMRDANGGIIIGAVTITMNDDASDASSYRAPPPRGGGGGRGGGPGGRGPGGGGGRGGGAAFAAMMKQPSKRDMLQDLVPSESVDAAHANHIIHDTDIEDDVDDDYNNKHSDNFFSDELTNLTTSHHSTQSKRSVRFSTGQDDDDTTFNNDGSGSIKMAEPNSTYFRSNNNTNTGNTKRRVSTMGIISPAASTVSSDKKSWDDSHNSSISNIDFDDPETLEAINRFSTSYGLPGDEKQKAAAPAPAPAAAAAAKKKAPPPAKARGGGRKTGGNRGSLIVAPGQSPGEVKTKKKKQRNSILRMQEGDGAQANNNAAAAPKKRKRNRGSAIGLTKESEQQTRWIERIPWWLLPLGSAVFSMCDAAFRMLSVLYLAASIAEMFTSGTEIVFGVLAARFIRKRLIPKSRWYGTLITTCGLTLIACSDLISGDRKQDTTSKNLPLGILFAFGKAMSNVSNGMSHELITQVADLQPNLLLGLEGCYGLSMALPLYLIIGPRIGYYPAESAKKIFTSVGAVFGMIGFIVILFLSSSLSTAVIAATSSMTRNMWKNFRGLVVWLLGLLIYYASGDDNLGEPWTIPNSFVVLSGFATMMVGLYIYYKDTEVKTDDDKDEDGEPETWYEKFKNMFTTHSKKSGDGITLSPEEWLRIQELMKGAGTDGKEGAIVEKV